MPDEAQCREHRRIRFLLERDGERAARAWVERTLHIYRQAVHSQHSHASTPHYRPEFQASIRVFEDWLNDRSHSDPSHG